MRAITVFEPDHMEMLEVEKPVITNPGQVLVKIKAAGICGSDIHVKHGTNPYATYPRVSGHEASGEIEAVGERVKDLKPGDGVVFEPITYCGKCYACRNGHHNVCRELKVLGCTVDGPFSDYVVCDQNQVYPFDKDKISYVQAALCEPYTIGTQANWRGAVKAGDFVLVHGAGPIGLIVADVANENGAKVIVSEPNQNRLKMAKEFGADYLINPLQDDLRSFIEEITDGEGVNVIFEAAGVPGLLTEAVELLSPAGRLVAMTFGKELVPINVKAINAKELTVLGTRHQYNKFPETIAAHAGRLDRVDRLTTHIFPAWQFKEAFAVLEDKNSTAGKVVLLFD